MAFKKIISTSILIIWMIIIFIFSNQNSIDSIKVSDKVASKTLTTVSEVTGKNLSENRKKELVINSRFIVRKIAHFTLYFILFLLIYTVFRSYGVSKYTIVYSLIFCFVASMLDEFHQLFSAGRTSRMLDVIIDTMGAFTSSLLVLFLKRRKA